jgi:hypothetical protein
MIKILSESEGNLLVIEASGKLTTHDYESVLIPLIERLIRQYNRINVVIHLGSQFLGWEAGALWDDAKSGLKHRKEFSRVALVGASPLIENAAKMGSFLMDGELRTFDEASLGEAIKWTKQTAQV